MERTLSLVLDEQGHVSLTLLKDEADKIDEFTMKKFEDSEEIREYFKGKIDNYLNENANYIKAIEEKTKKKFRGRIIILEARQYRGNLEYVEKKVLYKKHLFAFKEIVKDEKTMKRFLKLENRGVNEFGFRRLLSGFVIREITHADFHVKSRVDLIRKEIKNSKNFNDILRIIIKAYKEERKQRPNLPTIESIYKEKLTASKKESKQSARPILDQDKEDKILQIDGFEVPLDELVLYDLEDWENLRRSDAADDIRIWPDGLGIRDEKRTR